MPNTPLNLVQSYHHHHPNLNYTGPHEYQGNQFHHNNHNGKVHRLKDQNYQKNNFTQNMDQYIQHNIFFQSQGNQHLDKTHYNNQSGRRRLFQ